MDSPISPPPSSVIVPLRGTKEGPIPHPSKFVWLLAVLAILTLGILAGFLGSNVLYQSSNQSAILPTSIPTPTPTLATGADIFADWKSYTNTAFRYSIKYPNDWNANSIGPGIGTIPLDNVQRGLLLTPPIPTPAGGMGVPTEDIHIRIEIDSRQTSGETYEEWVNSTKKDLNDTTNSISESEIASTKTIVIKTGFKIIYLLSSPDKTKFIFIETQTPTSEYRNVIDQILSTFRLLQNEPGKCLTTTDPCEPLGCDYNPQQCSTIKKPCGGIAGTMCPDGYTCKLDGSYPDASGVCTKEL